MVRLFTDDEFHWPQAQCDNPPGVMASALNVAVLKLQGHEFKDGVFTGAQGTAIYIPIPLVDNANLNQTYEEVKDQPGYFSVTTTVSSDDALKQYFKKISRRPAPRRGRPRECPCSRPPASISNDGQVAWPLDGADFTLGAGEVHALLGSNGCGKSTLCKIIAGAVGADSGELLLDGRAANFVNPAEAAAAGVEMFYQELSLIPAMTVAENIFLGREPRGRLGLVDARRLRSDASAAIRQFTAGFGAEVDAGASVMDLTADQRQIVEILKVLARDPRLIIFDEATAALDRDQVEAVFARIRR